MLQTNQATRGSPTPQTTHNIRLCLLFGEDSIVDRGGVPHLHGNMVIRKQAPAGALPYPDLFPRARGAEEEDSIVEAQLEPYSPSLHNSPAFNLRTLGDVQKSPCDTMANAWSENADREEPQGHLWRATLQAGSSPPSSEKLRMIPPLPETLRSGNNNKSTPRSSFDSQRSKDFWEEEGNDGEGTDQTLMGRDTTQAPGIHTSVHVRQQDAFGNSLSPSANLAGIKRKPVADLGSTYQTTDLQQSASPPTLASNNPFRRLEASDDNVLQEASWRGEQHVMYDPALSTEPPKGDTIDARAGMLQAMAVSILASSLYSALAQLRQELTLPADETPIQMTAHLTLDDRPFSMFSSSYRPSEIDLSKKYHAHDLHPLPQLPLTSLPPHPSAPPPPIPGPATSTNEQARLIPVTPKPVHEENSWAAGQYSPPVHSPFAEVAPYDRLPNSYAAAHTGNQETGTIGLDKQLPSTSGITLSYEEPCPPLPLRPYQRQQHQPAQEFVDRSPESEVPPPKPPRPNSSPSHVSETEWNKLREKRNETYQIKHFNWFDHNTGKLRQSSMLTQNTNGPCPLLALVNALILGNKEATASALDSALNAREQVSLGLIIESLMDELTSDGRLDGVGDLPDVDVLNSFLLKLHTGMNANPRLAVPEASPPPLMDARNSVLHLPLSMNSDRTPGTFEETADMLLYAAFSIPLVHGWLPPRSDPSRAAFARAAPTYEDAQTIQFGEEELEHKLSQAGLNAEEQQLWQDIMAIKHFFQLYPTQLTPYGLGVIHESLYPGGFAIMFRNDHFSTIYKHPDSGQLFTLVTDAGYFDRAEIIWESLNDVTGEHSEFFSGDFRSVASVDDTAGPSHAHPPHAPPTPLALPSTGQRRRPSGQRLTVSSASSPIGPASPQEQQEQADADFAMALQLQEEEESRAVNGRRRSRPSQSSSNRDRGSSIPVRLRSQQETRPRIPPRNQHTSNQGVSRPADSNPDGEAPPPAYEEAAKGAPYIPPPGHPQHPLYDPSPRSSTSQISPASGPSRPGRRPERRRSAFQENSQNYGSPGMRGGQYSQGVGMGQGPGRRKDPEKDCTVM